MELKFEPLESFIEPGFWAKLGELKLHAWRLDEGPQPLTALYQPSPPLCSLSTGGVGGGCGPTPALKCPNE